MLDLWEPAAPVGQYDIDAVATRWPENDSAYRDSDRWPDGRWGSWAGGERVCRVLNGL